MPVLEVLRGRSTDVGGLPVTRVLPQARRRAVGPFVFVDHMGPAVLQPGQNLDVRPHPHIGLATVTYLFAGAIEHRDSIGRVQRIEPGDVNWMTAGRGIVHSERQPADLRGQLVPMHGVQTWVALPADAEDADPSFVHVPAALLPTIERSGASARVVAGHAFGATSPVPVFSDTLYAALTFAPGGAIEVPADHEERAIFVTSGQIEVDGTALTAGDLAVLAPGPAHGHAAAAAEAMLLGGAPLGERVMWWNFVATSRARIDAAKAQWARYSPAGAPAGGSEQFPPVPGDPEFIPLPPR